MTDDGLTQDRTRQRLLEAAGEVFAEQGFRAATVREICARAGANVAAVNYHFGDKERLYAEVLKFAHRCAIVKYPPGMGLAEGAPAEERLRAFVMSFLSRMLDEGRPAWHAKIMSREMAEPTAAMDVLVHEQIKPHFGYLSGVMRELLGAAADEEAVRRCCFSVVGQCLFYHFGKPVMARLMPGHTFGMKDAEGIGEHIVRLTMEGIRGIARKSPHPGPLPEYRARESGGQDGAA